MKKIISLVLSVVMVLSGTVFAAPVIESVESAEEFVSVTVKTEETENYELSSGSSVKPGLNLWTGDANAYTFTGTTDSDLYAYRGATIATNGSNTYVKMAGSLPAFSLNKTMPAVEKDRPVRVTFKTLVDAGGSRAFRVSRNNLSAIEPYFFIQALAAHATIWQTIDKTVKGADLAATGGADDTQDIKNFIIAIGNDCSADNVCIDDVSFVPYYKVNYDANGGTGTVEADYFENGTYTDLDNGSALSKNGAKFSGWSTSVDGPAVTSVTAVPGEDITLYAVWESTAVKPGLNLWTGDANAYTFTGTTNSDLYAYRGATIATNGSNTYVKMAGSLPAFSLNKTMPAVEKDRPVRVTFKTLVDAGGSRAFRVVRNNLSAIEPYFFIQALAAHATIWQTIDKTVKGADLAATGGADDTQDIKNFIIAIGNDCSDDNVCIDDVSFVPYYKVNYDANGGTGTVEADYFENGTYTDLDNGSALSMEGAEFGGWSTSVNGPAVTSVTAVPGEDITLYARWLSEDVTVKFAGDIVAMADVETKNGALLDLTPYLNVTLSDKAVAEHKRFNGWTATGNEADITTTSVVIDDTDGDGVVTLYAVVNHDFNFALEANRKHWYSARADKQTVETGASGKTILVTGLSTFTNTQVLDGHVVDENTTTDFEISASQYKGAVIYFANDWKNGSTASKIENLTSIYGLGISNSGDKHGTWISGTSDVFCKPNKLPGWGSSSFGSSLEKITDNGGNVLYVGVPVTTETSDKMATDWTGTINSIAIAIQYSKATFEVRYVKFLPNNYIDKNISLAAPVAGEAPQTIVSGTGYTGTVTWTPAVDGTFAPATNYTATVTITPDAGWSAYGVPANGYVVPGATKVTNTADALTFKASYLEAYPGINVWTGTEEAFNFDNSEIGDFYVGGGPALETDGTNKYMKLGSQLAHFTLKGDLPEIDADRKVKVSFNYKTDAAKRTIALIRNVMNYTTPTWGQKEFAVVNAGSWNNIYTQDIFGTGAGDVTNNSSYITDNTQNIKNVVFMGINSDLSTNPLYIDNVSVVPYYKVTYDAAGGVTAPTDAWWLPATAGENYTVSAEKSVRAGYKFLGWSVDGETAVTQVVPANEDIALVALWEEDPDQEALTYDFASTVPGVADGSISIVAPDASYTTATIYFADDNGVLDEYTAFGTATLTQGLGTYTVTGKRAFAAGSTKLVVVFEGAETSTKEYVIPAEHRLTKATPLYKYFVVSDPHLGGNADNIDNFYMQTGSTATRTYAYGTDTTRGDIFKLGEDDKTDVDFVIVNGDLVNYGHDEEIYWDVLDGFIERRLNNKGVPVFLTNGNHEFFGENSSIGGFVADRLVNSITGQVDYIEENYGDSVTIIRDEANPDALYYAVEMYGSKYIFMSTPDMSDDKTTATYAPGAKQLKFVEDQLFDGEKSGKTNYIITHMPLNDANSAAVKALVERHPGTIVFVSHTHNNLGYDTHYTVVGDMATGYTVSDTGATSYLESNKSGEYVISYNAGQYVEVYSDKVLIKARKFAEESKFFGHALYLVDTVDTVADFTVSVSGTAAAGETLTALVNGVVAEDGAYTYEWIIAGETVGNGKTYTCKANEIGEYVHLRVTAADGSFASCNSEMAVASLPKTLNVASMRIIDPQGIRIAGFVTTALRNQATEYGFIVALATSFESEEEYTTLTADNETITKVIAKSYEKNVVDTYFIDATESTDAAKETFGADASDELGMYFTGVYANVPKNAEAYKTTIVGRTYVKIGDKYVYGAPVAKSVYNVALALKAKYENLGQAVPEFVTEAIAIAEAE